MRLGSRIPVILDAKRGDIASTAEAYARSAFEVLGADAITLSPYLGRDSVEPFIRDPREGRVPAVQDQQRRGRGSSGPAGRWTGIQPVRCIAMWPSWPPSGTLRATSALSLGRTYPETLAEVRQQRAASLVPCSWRRRTRQATWKLPSQPACEPMARECLSMWLAASRVLADPRMAAAELRDRINAARHALGGTSRSVHAGRLSGRWPMLSWMQAVCSLGNSH